MLKGRLGEIRDWMKNHHIPPRLLFFFLGIISTLWFLVRVIPKPSRATYPCMRVAAPFMSGLIVYLLSVGGLTLVSRKIKGKIINVRYSSTLLLISAVIVTMAITPSANNTTFLQNNPAKMGPDDGPNQPVGKAMGIYPGRVTWAWDTTATNRNSTSNFFTPLNTDQKVVSKMVSESVIKLTGKSTVAKSWDAMFRYFNMKKHSADKGYTPGEKIFIKINQTNAGTEACQTNPFIVLEILRQLVNGCGIDQAKISVGDPMKRVNPINYDAWSAEFPNIVYIDKSSAANGRTLIHPTSKELLFYSDKVQADRLYDICENADYMINVANLKPHLRAGVTLTSKNHFGSNTRMGAYHLHYSHVSPVTEAKPTNAGYHKYRVMVDLMGSKYLGQNTLLYVIDGLYGGGAGEGGPPVKYYMAPFSNDWSNSVFISQDQVALESVCYDFLRTEWNGTYSHDPRNNRSEIMPNVNGVDDYLHQAADSVNWPKGISYDPDNSGKPLSSLGVHEHWNNPVNKQYSHNLGKTNGIELVSIPAKIVGTKAPAMITQTAAMKIFAVPTNNAGNNASPAQTRPTNAASETVVVPAGKEGKFASVVKRTFTGGFKGKKFYSAVVDGNNGKWFLTDLGLVSGRYAIISENSNVPTENLKNLVFEFSSEGPGLWISTPQGAIAATLPINSSSIANTFSTKNSAISSDTVFSIAIGRNNLRWFGTDKGISAVYDKKWLTPKYQILYPESMFKDYPITAMATTANGDTLYAATEGAGITRVYRNNVDAISGASQYAQWGPIEIPSDKIYSICITRDGTQWFGTDNGVTRHTGYNTLENWTVFTKEQGLVDNFVQAIEADSEGKIWFGTKGGISVFDGTKWTSYTMDDGLISNNILCIMVDKNGMVYLGTDNGLMVYNNGQLVTYQSAIE